MLTVKAPVSLVIAGEWASREEGNHCIASAINKNIIISLEAMEQIIIKAPSLGIPSLTFNLQQPWAPYANNQDEKFFSIIASSINTTMAYLAQLNIPLTKFALGINTENISITQKNGDIHWIDLNLEATIGTALVKAILQLHEQPINSAAAKQQIFKLAFIAQYARYNNHEFGCEIAASVYGATILYQQVTNSWFAKQLIAHKDTLSELVNKPWPNLKITPLNMPEELKLCVCFINEERYTTDIFEKVEHYKATYPVRYRQLCASINIIVQELSVAIEQNNKKTILELIRQNKQLLKHLLEESGNKVETPALNTLINCAEECGAAAKFSGSQNTGYGFALCMDRFTAQKIKRKWEKKGVQMLNTQLLG